MLSFFVGLPSPRLRGLIWAWFYAVTSISAIEKRFRNVADGNISRLRDAQAFHAAVKWPPYFMFARQRRHFTAGHNLPGFLWGAEQKKTDPLSRVRLFVIVDYFLSLSARF